MSNVPQVIKLSDWSKVKRIVPIPDDLTRPFWDAAKNGVLSLQHCKKCGTYNHPPAPTCLNCMSTDLEYKAVSGKGVIYSYTINFHDANQAYAPAVPYASIIVEPVEGPGCQIAGNLLNVPYTEAHVGRKVKVVFEKLNDDITLPQWVLDE